MGTHATEHVSTYSTILKTTVVLLAALAWTSLLTCGESQHCVLLNSICQQSYGWGNLHSADTACSCSCTACLWTNQIQLICGGLGPFSQNKTFHKAVTRAVIDQFWCAGPWKALSWEVESWSGCTSSLYDKQSCSTMNEPSDVSAMAPAQPDWWDCFLLLMNAELLALSGAGSWCEGRSMLLAPLWGFCAMPGAWWRRVKSLQGYALWWAAPWGQLFPALSHVPALVGKEGRGTCVRSLALVIHGASAPRCCFNFIPPDCLPYKAKMSRCRSTGASGWQGWFRQPGTQAERGCLLPS